ncbi:MAG: DUF6786 family protein [Ginsengibacter sp.]
MTHIKNVCLLYLLMSATACNNTADTKTSTEGKAWAKGTYAYDADFLKKHTQKVVELMSNDRSSRILLSADYQGRVMTSTASGDSGLSFGWLNYDLISAPQKKKQFNPVGGEERFWLGPEGGQYSIYFKQNDSFNFNHWQVPALVDTVTYEITQSDRTSALFNKTASVTNYSGTVFNINIERKISMLTKADIETKLKTPLSADIQSVAYQTENTLKNVGTTDWSKDKGLLSIWLLGMFTPTPKTTVIIPFAPIPDARSFITDNYFGVIPADRLIVKDSVLYFKCDGNYRSKIGLSPKIAKPMAAAYDFEHNVLTLVLPTINKDAAYLNSKWELQKQPYKGDVINSYNDGKLDNGTQMGPFYEVESSSPALELKAGKSATYTQVTLHLQGSYNSLRDLVKNILQVDLDELKR